MKVTTLVGLIALSMATASGVANAAPAKSNSVASSPAEAPDVRTLTKDVGGVALGDSLDAAREKMKKANPNFIIVDIPTDSGSLYGVLAYEPGFSRREAKDAFMVLPSADKKVALISRQINLAQDASFTREQLVDSLNKKYGPVYERSGEQFWMKWRYDLNGKLHGQHDRGCNGLIFNSDSNVVPGSTGTNEDWLRTYTQKITTLPGNCLAAIEAEYKTDPLGIISQYTVTIVNVRQFYNDVVEAEKAASSAAERQRAEIEARAKASGGPKL